MGNVGKEGDRYEKAKRHSEKKDKKNPDAGVKNGERAKKITGITPGSVKRQDPSVAVDNRGSRMSPQALRSALGRAAENTAALGRAAAPRVPKLGNGRAATA